MKKKFFLKTWLTMVLLLSANLLFAVKAPVTVNAYDSQGNPIAAKFQVFKGPNYVGEFNTGTSAMLDVGDTYKLFAHYQNTSTARETFTVDPAGNTFSYSTTKVTFHWTGGYLDYRGSGSWRSFGKTGGVWNSRELFPKDFYGNTMQFHIGFKWNDVRSMTFTLDYSGQTTVEKVLSQLQLLDHNGNPLSGGTARGGYANPTVWHVAGSTNANGLLLDMRNGSNSNLSYEMKYNNTTSWSPQQTSSIYEFATQLITLRLETCAGAPIDGGHVRWGHGTSFGSYHFVGGNTGSSATGETNAEFFPGTYSFEMGITSTTDTKISWNFPGDGATIVFKTTKVTLNYSGIIAFGGPTGDSRYFIKPSMELLPGTYKFNFRPSNRVDLTIGNCASGPLVVNAVFIRLIDHLGNGLAGGVAKYYKSGWKPAGTTDANGTIFLNVAGLSGNIPFRMYWKGGSIQKTQNITTNSTVIFQTELVTCELNNSSGGDLSATFKYYASGWKTFGSGTPTILASMELLPKSYPFRVYYAGGSLQKNQDVGSNPAVVFATVAVTAELNNSSGGDLSATFKYYASGWKTFGSGTPTILASMELLPKSYPFRVYYAGGSLQKNQDVGSNPAVVFATVAVTAELNNSSGGDLSATFKYYASGWKTFGSGTPTILASMELLPKSYPFRVYYAGGSLQKNQDVGSNPAVVFATVAVTAELNNSSGGDLSATFKYYASGWKTFGSGTPTILASMELLPKSYPFRVYYAGGSLQKNQDVGSNPAVVFATVAVSAELNDCGGTDILATFKYYASGWKIFGTGTPTALASMELLPNNYPFRVYYGGASLQKNQNVGIDPTVVFTATNVTINYPGKVTYYASGWKTFKTNATTSVTKPMLPKTYPFRFYALVGNQSTQMNITITGCAAGAGMNLSYLTLIDNYGNGVPGGKAQPAYGGSWGATAPGATDANGHLLVNLAPGYTKINMTVNQSASQQTLAQLNASGYTWTTGTALIQVNDDSGSPIPGVAVHQGGGYWYYWGVTDAAGQFKVPTFTGASLKFKAKLNNSSKEITHTNATTFLFQTGKVKRDMVYVGTVKASIGGSWKYLWPNQGSAAQLFPGSYYFNYNNVPNEWVTVVAGATNIIPQGGGSKRQIGGNDNASLGLETGVYPNPFSDFTTFTFELNSNVNVRILIYNLSGEIVKTITDSEYPRGLNEVQWNGDNNAGSPVASGVYLYRIEAGTKVIMNKVIITR
jgi:flagellar hook capping protein FlgD